MQNAAIDKRLEGWLDQLIGDKGLRDEFFLNPSLACASVGVALSWSEVGALLALPTAYLDEFAKGLAPLPGCWADQPVGPRGH